MDGATDSRVARPDARTGPPADGEPNQNAGGAPARSGDEPRFSGVHAALRPRPPRPRPTVPSYGAVEAGAGARARQAAWLDDCEYETLARRDHHGGQHAVARLDGLLSARLSACRVSRAQSLPVLVFSPESEPTAQSSVSSGGE